MAKWQPENDPAIGKNEQLGRRLFDEPMLVGVTNQKNFGGLLLRHFEETRDVEFSLDRLGRTGIDQSAVRYLNPRAEAAGTRFKPQRAFNGWAVVKADYLRKPHRGPALELVASPIKGDGLEENHHHAHAVLPSLENAYANALHLRQVFVQYGSIHPSGAGAQTEASVPWWLRFWYWLRSRFVDPAQP